MLLHSSQKQPLVPRAWRVKLPYRYLPVAIVVTLPASYVTEQCGFQVLACNGTAYNGLHAPGPRLHPFCSSKPRIE